MADGIARLDPLDRRIVAALQSNGRASWTEISELCETSVATAARRGQQLLRDGIVRVAVVPDINHAGAADLYDLRLGCRPGSQVKVCLELAKHPAIRFVALVSGADDIFCELNVRKDQTLQDMINEIQVIDGVQRCRTDLNLHTYKVAADWSRQLLSADAEVVVPELHECDPSHFDPVDHQIIEVMREDGRASFSTVAEAIGVNESTVRRRFETLQGRGCILVTTLVPAPALGFESELLFNITVEPPSLDAVARKLSTYRGVRFVAAMLSENTLMCEVILPTTKDIFDFTTNTLGHLEGVRGWTANMVLLTFRRGFVETPWWPRSVVTLSRQK
ncbi:DNA-binding Lrp family transcriptional regulator [Hamadaea flava]|uniref:Lrp/AsnC family transcriptional regulator n=1 Tax=Hamadaea flava TaxID=1742688 RepID=A0ABV8LP55_9ACTN|nr:Lrp/AsnC family transcriptional regulator [Hamadaea flava]MCP2323184.1 DNA-binding Lrp family transcriptional regulator [Hamadaea flava]